MPSFGRSYMEKTSKDPRKRIGAEGEEAAAAYLLNEGYSLIVRNWRCSRGELDIIAEFEGRLIFVEVRSRSKLGSYGTAKESVDGRKQRKVRETAEFYLHRYRLHERSIRFDVISIEYRGEGQTPLLEHTKGAF
jgi:putative endonuclease